MISNETKTLQFAPGFSKDKTKRLDNLKKFWKQNKTKAFGKKNLRTDRKRFVSIQNFDLKTFPFDLFWNESSKTEPSDLDLTLLVVDAHNGVLQALDGALQRLQRPVFADPFHPDEQRDPH